MDNNSFTSPIAYYSRRFLFISLTSILLTGCADYFRPLRVSNVFYYPGENAGDSVYVSYRMDMNYLSGNNKYGDKEKRKKLNTVALKIDNRSSHTIRITPSNFGIYDAHDKEKRIWSPKEYCKRVRISGLDAREFVYYVYTGGLLPIFEAFDGHVSNKALLHSLEESKIWNRDIPPHKAIYGNVCLSSGERNLGFFFNPKIKTVAGPVELNGRYVPPKKKLTDETFHFFVETNDQKIKDGMGRLRFNGCQESVELRVEGEMFMFFPSDTKQLILQMNGGKRIAGQSDGDHWIFKVIDGTIKGFNTTGDCSSIEFLQKLGGPIVPFSPEALQVMAENTDRVMDLVYEQKFVAAVKAYDEQF